MPSTSLSLSAAPATHFSASIPDAIYVGMLEFLKQQLPELAGYVESNAVGIVESFKELARQTSESASQMQEVIEVSRTIQLGGVSIPYEKSVEILYEPLGEAIDKILHVSKLAMEMVMMIGNAAENITRVEKCIGEVQKLTKQTNMLAMNTQIEAARAGEAGNSFRIIAQEVKSLSENIKDLSRQMKEDVDEVSRSVKQSSRVVDDLAHYDMTENLQLKTKIDELIESVMDQNKRFSGLLADAASTSRRTADHISQLVVGIQFQDRASQIIGDLVTVLSQATDYWRDGQTIRPLPGPNAADELATAILSNVKLSEIRQLAIASLLEQQIISAHGLLAQAKHPPFSHHMAAGEVDLF